MIDILIIIVELIQRGLSIALMRQRLNRARRALQRISLEVGPDISSFSADFFHFCLQVLSSRVSRVHPVQSLSCLSRNSSHYNIMSLNEANKVPV